MKINTHQQITDIIQRTIDQGESIETLTRKIMDGGWRNEHYQARRVAVTEVLRAHSVAREEAIQQSPSTDRKEWRHTGAHKNKPRPNHVDMDGQIVPKDKPFGITGERWCCLSSHVSQRSNPPCQRNCELPLYPQGSCGR